MVRLRVILSLLGVFDEEIRYPFIYFCFVLKGFLPFCEKLNKIDLSGGLLFVVGVPGFRIYSLLIIVLFFVELLVVIVWL